jgi:hypothetical protein
MKRIIFLVTIFSYFLISFEKKENDDLIFLLKKADEHRGGLIEGISWSLEVINLKNNQVLNTIEATVEATTFNNNQFALVTFLSPKKFQDQKLLIRNNNMWFSKKGVEKKISISGRQRLTGTAANADVANANYFIDYHIESSFDEILNGKKCKVLQLVAKNSFVSYSKIKYWISIDEQLGLKTEFYGKSDKIIKTALFEYQNKIRDNFKFISKIYIYDNIDNSYQTILNISNPKLQKFNNSKFDK